MKTRAASEARRRVQAAGSAAVKVKESGAKLLNTLLPTVSFEDFAVMKRILFWVLVNIFLCLIFPLLAVSMNAIFSDSASPKLSSLVAPTLFSFALTAFFNFLVSYTWVLSLRGISLVRKICLDLFFAIVSGASYTSLLSTFGFSMISTTPFTIFGIVTVIVYLRAASANGGISDILLQPARPYLTFELKKMFFRAVKGAVITSVYLSVASSLCHMSLYSFQYVVHFIESFILSVFDLFLGAESMLYLGFCSTISTRISSVAQVILNLSGANTLSIWQTFQYCLSFSFYVYFMSYASTSFLKLLTFYPMDFKKLQLSNSAFHNRAKHSHEVMVNAMSPDTLPGVDVLVPEQKDQHAKRDMLWRRLLLAQQKLSDAQLRDTVRPEYSGPPRLVYLLGRRNTFFENVRKLLAYQDFARCVRCCKEQRIELYTRYEKIHDSDIVYETALQSIVYEASTLINAVTLQLQMMIAHAIVEVFPENKSPMSKTPNFPIGPLSSHWNGSVNWAAQEMAENDKKRRDKTIAGSFLRRVYDLGYIGYFLKLIFGSVIDPVPIPYVVVQQVANAAEGISTAFLYALTEDQTGSCYSSVPVVVSSLIGLQIAVQDYYNMLQRSVHVGGGAPFKCRKEMPGELKVLLHSSEDALNRIFLGYQDVIPDFAFPEIYAKHISERLRKV